MQFVDFLSAIVADFCKLLSSLNFLRIRGSTLNNFKYIIPTGITGVFFLSSGVMTAWPLASLDLDYSKFGSGLGGMIGFYIAALAIVASFKSEMLDEDVAGGGVSLARSDDIDGEPSTLTRRQLLSLAFGYAGMIAFLLVLLGVILNMQIFQSSNIWEEWIDGNFGLVTIFWIGQLLAFIYIWFFSSMIVISLLGVHYLVDKAHQ